MAFDVSAISTAMRLLTASVSRGKSTATRTSWTFASPNDVTVSTVTDSIRN